MKNLALLLWAWASLAQTRINIDTQTRNVDFSNATSTKPFKMGTSLPATCSTGEAFFKTNATAGQNWFGCTATNVWSLQDSIPSVGQVTDLTVSKTSSTALAVTSGNWGVGNQTFSYAGGAITIQSLSISGATNASPIVITISSTAAFRNGDTVTVAAVLGNTAANGTWVVSVASNTQLRLEGSTGSGGYTSGGIVAGTSTGSAKIYASDSGTLVVEHPASAALVLTCSGACVVHQVESPEVPASGSPIAEVSIANGLWNTVLNTRHLITNRGVRAGLGITVDDAGGTAQVSVNATVARLAGANVWTGSNSFTAATRSAPFRAGAGTPAGNCTLGDTYWQNDASAGQNLWGCTVTGTPGQWAPMTGSSASAPALEEEFYSPPASWRSVGDNAAVADALTGAAGFNHPGLLSVTTNASANSVSSVTTLAANGAHSFVNLGSTTGWTLDAIAVTQASMPSSQVALRFGLSSSPSSQSAADAVQVRYNNNSGCTATASDSFLTYETRASSASTASATSQAIGSLQSIHLRVRSIVAGTALFAMSIDGAAFTTEVAVTGVPTAAVSPFFAIFSCTSAAVKLYADYFRFVPGVLLR